MILKKPQGREILKEESQLGTLSSEGLRFRKIIRIFLKKELKLKLLLKEEFLPRKILRVKVFSEHYTKVYKDSVQIRNVSHNISQRFIIPTLKKN